MEDCYNGIAIPNRIVEECNGDYKSTDCILSPNALAYLGLPANSSQADINTAIEASLLAKDEGIALGAPQYKVYTALLTQVGTNAPDEVVLENTIGDITLEYDSVGVYSLNLEGGFPEDKTCIIFQTGNDSQYAVFEVYRFSDDKIIIDDGVNLTDGRMDIKRAIEVRVYN